MGMRSSMPAIRVTVKARRAVDIKDYANLNRYRKANGSASDAEFSTQPKREYLFDRTLSSLMSLSPPFLERDAIHHGQYQDRQAFTEDCEICAGLTAVDDTIAISKLSIQ